ncbi:MAG: DUF6498-containing protein [Bacteroidetes bacterium]|nr:DUF6498-containing protein [Bacteroidota bacterium]
MNAPTKINLKLTDLFLILINLVPIWGVWVNDWSVKDIFLVYCMESVIMGAYNVLMMWSTTLFKRKDEWVSGNVSSMVSGYYFILFFIAHYGFFILIQLGLFISISKIGNLDFKDSFVLLFHIRSYLPNPTYQLLMLFIISYGIIVLKDFFIPGLYKTASLGSLMFSPYARVFVQQFCLLLGGLLFVFSLGKIFIILFVIIKIFFEVGLKFLIKWDLSKIR